MGNTKSKEPAPPPSSSHLVSNVVDFSHQQTEIGRDTSGISLSKTIIDFKLGEKPCPLKSAVNDSFEITNTSNDRLRFNFEPSFPKEFQLTFSPAAGTIDRNKSKTVKVKLIVSSKINLNHKVTLKIDDDKSSILTVKIRCETGVFGVDPATLDMIQDDGFVVPAILVSMKRSLIEYGGMDQEGIFRLAGEQTEIKRIKEIMNKKEFDSSNDVNTVASLIKIWYREMPTPILNSLPSESIYYSSDLNDCVAAFNTLPEMQKNLLEWLMDLLLAVAHNSSVNKMTSQNLAIVVAPNLYDVSASNPMEGLVMSQKCVQFLHNVLTWKMQN
eukprot:TRINITY_DN4938_c0_g1_i1.p1 TRINITY_DN4938_c0_g1~~TRINITY_DN4938_c0_g1_i1.p1  ORF type:complete len:328 (-),score=64.61 TRINITY_DN4938_c0_g1_i1:202-1185(-)